MNALPRAPGAALTLAQALCNIDVRDDLPAIRSATLIRMQANPVLDARHGEGIAAQIQYARVEEAQDDWRWMSETDLEASSLARVAEFLGLHYDPHPYRILATVLFTDIVGSTQTAAEMGDDRWRLLVDAHNREVARQVTDAGGQIAHWTGDGVLAVFATPTMALRAAIAIRGRARGPFRANQGGTPHGRDRAARLGRPWARGSRRRSGRRDGRFRRDPRFEHCPRSRHWIGHAVHRPRYAFAQGCARSVASVRALRLSH